MTQNFQLKNCITSEVENTLTIDCFFNRLSLDQRGHCNFNAKAKYATSSGSGEISFAFERKYTNSMAGKNSILPARKFNILSNSTPDKPVFSWSSFLCSSTSPSKDYGEKTFSKGEKKISAVCPSGDINAAISTLASTTTSIQNAEGYIFLNFSCMDLLIFLPKVMLSSSASFSESLDLLTMDLNKASSDNLCRMAMRATSDQLISGQWSISIFISCGTANVSVGIDENFTINTLNTLDIFKSIAG